MSESIHVPVLLAEVLDALAVRPGGRYVDATVNGGGHAAEILRLCGPDGCVLGIDRDPDLIVNLGERFHSEVASGRFIAVHSSFSSLAEILERESFAPVDGILFDLGLSSYHFEASNRGFSFQRSERLDMRFDASDQSLLSAADLLADTDAATLTNWIRTYGEERFASRIARTVVARQRSEPVQTAADLLDAVRASLPGKLRWRADRHAARVFQALRIVVNQELQAVEAVLPQAIATLAPGGRLAVISFHSLEDRIVKHFLRNEAQQKRVRLLTKRPIVPSEEEVATNSRAGSAKLRVAERTVQDL